MILFGVLFALFSDTRRQGVVLLDPYLWHAFVFASLFNAAVVYAIKIYPDWMWMYFLENSRNTTSELVYLFVFLYYFQVALGFFLGRDLKRLSPVGNVFLIGLLVGAEAWLLFRLFDRYVQVGTRAEFLSGQAKSLFAANNPMAPIMNGAVGLMVCYYLVVCWRFWRMQKKRHL